MVATPADAPVAWNTSPAKLPTGSPLAAKVAAALRKFPQFNSSVDMASHEIVYKKYVNIGIAVDTDRGLLVPVIRDADAKNVTDISVSLVQLSEKAVTLLR